MQEQLPVEWQRTHLHTCVTTHTLYPGLHSYWLRILLYYTLLLNFTAIGPALCHDPGAPQNGQRIVITTDSNVTLVYYACFDGFELVDGSSRRTCQPSGSFDGHQPRCTPISREHSCGVMSRDVSTQNVQVFKGRWCAKYICILVYGTCILDVKFANYSPLHTRDCYSAFQELRQVMHCSCFKVSCFICTYTLQSLTWLNCWNDRASHEFLWHMACETRLHRSNTIIT